MRAHVGITERFAWTRNRTVKAAHEADLCSVIHPSPIGVVDEDAEALLLGKILEDAAPEGECHCHTIFVVSGGSAITGLGSRGARGWLRLMFEGRPGIDAEGAKQEPEKDSADSAVPLRLCILERRQIRAAMRTKEGAAAAARGATATGYRVSLVPGGLEVSARLASNEELAILVKVLEANMGSLGRSSD